MPNDFDTQDNIEDLEEKLKHEKAKRKQKMVADALEEFVTENEIYYVSKQDRYFLRYPDGEWTDFAPDALKRAFPIMADKNCTREPNIGVGCTRTYLRQSDLHVSAR